MVRAATTGAIDFRMFDPHDTWWWRKLQWSLNEVAIQDARDICRVRHNHWVTLAAHGNLTAESFDQALTNSKTAINRLLKATYPWLADEIGEDGTKSAREEAVAAYHDYFGKPGEARYEAMVDTLLKEFKKGKLSQREKEADRARRRKKWAEQRLARSQGS